MAARRLIFEILGEDASAQQAIRRTSRSLGTLDRDIGRAVRGAAAGSGIFRSLGRSIAFASGGFLAFASAGEFLRKSIDAAIGAQVAQKQLARQLANSGKSFSDYRAQIDKTNIRLGALSGFTNDDLNVALTTILRTVPNVSKALRDEATAADLARAKHISLSQAALIIAKTEAGNTTLLRRQGFQISKNATVEQALARVRQVVAGQARVGTTQQEKFGAVLHDTEEIIGNGLLPTINRYLISGTEWLQQMDESGRLQKDVASAAGSVQRAVKDGATAFRLAKGAVADLDRVTGSFENTLKDLVAVWLVLKGRTTLIKWGVIASELNAVKVASKAAAVATGELAAAEAVASVGWTRLAGGALLARTSVAQSAAALTATGAAAEVAATRVSRLSVLLSKLKVLGPIAIAVGVTEFISFAQNQSKKIAAQRGSTFVEKGSSQQFAFGGRGGVFAAGQVGPTSPLGPLAGVTGIGNISSETAGSPQRAAAAGLAKIRASVVRAAKSGVSLRGQFNLLELKLADAQRQNNTILQRSILVSEESIVVQLRDQAKKLKDRTQFAQQAASIEDQIRGIDSAAAEKQKQAREAAKRAAAAAKKKADEAKKLRESFNVPLALQVDQARAEALGSKTTLTSVLEKIKAAAQKALRSGRLGLQGQLDAWSRIGQINDELKQHVQGDLTKFKHVNTATLLDGLGLTADELRVARVRLAMVGAGGTVPGQRTPAFAGAGATIVMHNPQFHGVTDIRKFEDELNKRARSRPHRRRGG